MGRPRKSTRVFCGHALGAVVLLLLGGVAGAAPPGQESGEESRQASPSDGVAADAVVPRASATGDATATEAPARTAVSSPEPVKPGAWGAKRTPPRPRERPRTLETDPIDLLSMAPGRAVYLWPASPRLRTGLWIAVHYFMQNPRPIRRYDPELLYTKADSHFVTQVGGALRLGPTEISVNVPFAGLSATEFYEKGVVDQMVRKLDRADMNLSVKYGFRIQRGRDLWLITPYVALTAPTQKREAYTVNLGGHLLRHHTAPPRSLSVLPGFSAGWRRDMWSAVVGLGCLVTVPLARDSDLDASEAPQALQVGLQSVYQLGFSPFRDLGFTLSLLHLRDLAGPSQDQENHFWAALGFRLQPYAGLYGHLGLMVPLVRVGDDLPPVMVTLQAGWEFR